jgi:hypothetical protein
MNFFSSRLRSCPQCSERTLTVKDKKVTEYFHRGVVLHLVGYPIAMPLDVEMIQPAEGEVIAGKRLLERTMDRYARFFDVVLADALYVEAPFFNYCLEHGKDVIAVFKGEKRVLFQDALGAFALIEPKTWKEDRCHVRAWDADGFTTAEGVNVPLRVLHTEETVTKRHRQGRQWIETTEVHHWWWVTTIPLSRLSTRQLWEIAHRRWEIENNLFHTLVTYWSLDHCFKHEPTAILNFVLTLFIAFILLQSFYHGNLKRQRRLHLTLIALASELHLGLIVMDAPAFWTTLRGG